MRNTKLTFFGLIGDIVKSCGLGSISKPLLIGLVVLCIFVSADRSVGFPVQVINSNLHVWGSVSTFANLTYDKSSSQSPISDNIYLDEYTPPYEFLADGGSSAQLFSIRGEALASSQCPLSVNAELDVTFRPLYSHNEDLIINIGYGGPGYPWRPYGQLYGQLENLTDGLIIWDFMMTLDSDGVWDIFEGVQQYYFESDHFYRINFEINCFSNEGDRWVASMSTDYLQVVPEPTTILLLGLGLIGLAGFRRKA